MRLKIWFELLLRERWVLWYGRVWAPTGWTCWIAV